MWHSFSYAPLLVLGLAGCDGAGDDTGDDTGQDDTDSDTTDTGDTDTGDTGDSDSDTTDTGDTGDTDTAADPWPEDPWELTAGTATYQLKVDDTVVCNRTYEVAPVKEHLRAGLCPDCVFLLDVNSYLPYDSGDTGDDTGDDTATQPSVQPLCPSSVEAWPYLFFPWSDASPSYPWAGIGYVDDGLLKADTAHGVFFSFYIGYSGSVVWPLSGVLGAGTADEVVVPGTFTHTTDGIAWAYDPDPWYSAHDVYARGGYSSFHWETEGYDLVTAPTASLTGTLPCDTAEHADSYTVSVADLDDLRVSVDTPDAGYAFDPQIWVNYSTGDTFTNADNQFTCASGLCEGGAEADFSCCPSASGESMYNPQDSSGTYTIYVAPSARTSACTDTVAHQGHYTLEITGGTNLVAVGDNLRPKLELDATGSMPIRMIPTLDGEAHYEFEVDDAVVCNSTYALTGLEFMSDFCSSCDFMFTLESTETARTDTNACPNRDPWSSTFTVPYPGSYPDDRSGIAHVDGIWDYGPYGGYAVDNLLISFFEYAGSVYSSRILSGTFDVGGPYETVLPGTFTNNAGDITWSSVPAAVYSPRGAYVRNCTDRVDPAAGKYLIPEPDRYGGGPGDEWLDFVTTPSATQSGTLSCSPLERVDSYTFTGPGPVAIRVDTPTAATPFDPVIWVNDPEGCTVLIADDQFNCATFVCEGGDSGTADDYSCCPSAEFTASAGTYTLYVASASEAACTDAGHSGAYTLDVEGPTTLTPVDDDYRPAVEIRASGSGHIEHMTF